MVPAESAVQLHARALVESAGGRHAAARRLLSWALRRGPDSVLRAHLLVSLAYHEAERHGLAAGVALLDEADGVPDLPTQVRGLVAGQRGMLNMRAGQTAAAMAAFDMALRLLDERDPTEVCRVLLNRGALNLRQGRAAAARADFTRLLDVAAVHGLHMPAAKAHHNLGYVALLEGDLPRALREMDAVNPMLGAESPAFAGIYYLDRAQVLIAAGLFGEADEDLRRAVGLFEEAGMPQDRATAQLTLAQLAVLEDRWADARQLARLARRAFVRRGAQNWALIAASVAVTADVSRGHSSRTTVRVATELAADLAAAGFDEEARRTSLTAAVAAINIGDLATAIGIARRQAKLRHDDAIVVRLKARELRARLAEATGHPARAGVELRAALDDLHRYQSSFGSLDLQTAVSGHGRRFAEWGVRRALASGRPERVFGWAERARALSTRLPPVHPPDDPDTADLIEQLRAVRNTLRTQLLAGRPEPGLVARRTVLERLIRQRTWHVSGPGESSAPARLALLRERLGSAGDATFIAYLVSDGQLHALVVGARATRLRDLGPVAPVIETHRRLRADLEALAMVNLPHPVREPVRASYRNTLAALNESLAVPLRGLLGDGPLLLAPAAALVTTPWTLLPLFRGRPLTVVASATGWLAARKAVGLPRSPTVTAAAGPRVPRAEEEVRLVAGAWPTASVLTGSSAQAGAVREAAGATDVLHIAAHGVHEPDNPLFSHLELADGPLFGYEFERLPRRPHHVVLSACEMGLAHTRPGDETLGMTAALLHSGCGSVVGAVASIADDLACRVAIRHHAGLRQRLTPAAALAAALDEGDGEPAPLVCFGAGW